MIAYASGGVLETVRADLSNAATGVFFNDQSPSSLVKAIREFESKENQFCPQAIREHSLQFDSAVFKKEIADFVRFAIKDFKDRNQASDWEWNRVAAVSEGAELEQER